MQGFDLEYKVNAIGATRDVADGLEIEGYASLFGEADRGGDIVQPGAYAASLRAIAARKGSVRMLWQHDPTQPIGVWDVVREDARGLYVKGRLLTGIARAQEAASLIAAGAIDGLSIGYRTVTAARDDKGRRLLKELELWEVSLVTFPMLPSARVGAKGDGPAQLLAIAQTLEAARTDLADSRRSTTT